MLARHPSASIVDDPAPLLIDGDYPFGVTRVRRYTNYSYPDLNLLIA